MKKKICIFLAILLAFSSVNLYADDVETLKKRNAEIKEKLKASKEKQKENKEAIANESANLAQLNRNVQIQEAKLNELYAKIEGLLGNINNTIQEIVQMEASIEEKNQMFAKRIRAMYVMGDVNYLSVLLNSKDVHEALTNTSMMQMLLESDKRLIKEISDAKLELERKKSQLEDDKRALDDEKAKEENIKAQAEAAVAQKNAYIAQLKNNDAAFEREQKELEKDSQRVAALIQAAQQYQGGSYTGGRLGWPLPGYTRISSPFGYRMLYGRKNFHTGTDIPAPTGTTIIAAEEGRVTHAGWLGSYGQLVVISHGNGISTAYAHCSSINVGVGQVVSKGQAIARVGSTGNSTGPHLHFEVRVNGKAQNAMGWVR